MPATRPVAQNAQNWPELFHCAQNFFFPAIGSVNQYSVPDLFCWPCENGHEADPSPVLNLSKKKNFFEDIAKMAAGRRVALRNTVLSVAIDS